MTHRLKIEKLDVVRAGSDYLGVAWSIHVAHIDLVQGDKYELERPDGSTFDVWAIGIEYIDGRHAWHLTDEDGAMFLN